MKGHARMIAIVVASLALLTAGVQTALALTPNDVQYNPTTGTTTTDTTTTDTTTTGTTTTDTTTTGTTTTDTKTTEVAPAPQKPLTPPSQPSGVKGTEAQPQPQPTATTAGGTLPFTGLDLGLVFAAGALLIAGGFALRRLGRKSS